MTRVLWQLSIRAAALATLLSLADGARELLQGGGIMSPMLPDVLAAQDGTWDCRGNTCQRKHITYDDLWHFYHTYYPPPTPPSPPPPEKELVVKRVYGCHDDDDDPIYCSAIDRRIKGAMREIQNIQDTSPLVRRVPALLPTNPGRPYYSENQDYRGPSQGFVPQSVISQRPPDTLRDVSWEDPDLPLQPQGAVRSVRPQQQSFQSTRSASPQFQPFDTSRIPMPQVGADLPPPSQVPQVSISLEGSNSIPQ